MKTQGWQMAVAIGLGMSGAIVPYFRNYAFAQSAIIPDNTLGTGSSQVIPADAQGLPLDFIVGGTKRGANLFHSFREFNVNVGRAAYFIDPGNLQSIVARVTGGNHSLILNILGTRQIINGNFAPSNANFFLINPSGILFGPNTQLDVGASFVATTASAIQFGNQGFFSATSPNAPTLLTINPSAFLFSQSVNSPIVVTGRSPGVEVAAGNSLLFLGGNISIDGAILNARGGRVELGGVSGVGTVGLASLNADGNKLALAFPTQVERADVALIHGAQVNVAASGNGDISIKARNVALSGGSVLFAGVESGSGLFGSQAGDITIDAAEGISLRNGSAIIGGAFGVGDNGSINLLTKSLSLADGSQIVTTTSGQGNTGNINIETKNAIELTGASSSGSSSKILSSVGFGGIGNSGNINIRSGSLVLKDGAQISASTSGEGNAGNISIQVSDNITLAGASNDGFSGGISSAVEPVGVGRGGDITIINGGRFLVTGGAQVSTATFGQGDAGNLVILSRGSQELIGTSPDGRFSSGFSSEVGQEARGNGGNLIFRAGRLEVREGATISTRTLGIGNAGNLTIDGLSVSFDGQSASGFSSGAFSDVSFGARGNGGALNITANSLSVMNGAQINVSTGGQGNAGNLDITSSSIALEGVSSGLFAQVSPYGVGNGGDIRVATETLNVVRGAVISASTFGRGNGGNIDVQASEDIVLVGSNTIDLPNGIFSAVGSGAFGDGGNIHLSTDRSLVMEDGFQISSQSIGSGDGGNIDIFARRNLTANDSIITATSRELRGGKIGIESKNIFLSNSDITTNSITGIGDGGSIQLTARAVLAFGDSDIVAFTQDGRGGNITFNTLVFFGQNYNPFLPGADPLTLFGNSRVDVNASGKIIPSFITFSDTTFTQLSQNLISPNTLLANSCIVRRGQQNGSFTITGSGGLPQRPGDAPVSPFPTGEVRTVAADAVTDETDKQSPQSVSSVPHPLPRPWKLGDPIVEPQGVYQLANGDLVMSRECSK